MTVLSCGKDDPQNSSIIQGSGTGAAITGVINQGANCTTSPATVMVYSGQSVLQQSSVNLGASFTFQVSPGTYTIGAQTQNGACGVQQSVSVSQGQTGSVNMTLTQGGQYAPNQYNTGQYPNGQYPNGQYPYPYPSTVPGGLPPGYPYNQFPNTYGYGNPFIYMYGPYGYGYYYYNTTYGGYQGPCRFGNPGGWICQNTF